jgi:hypothetical protein
MMSLQDLYNDHALARLAFGRVIERVMGVDSALIRRLYTEAEGKRAATMTFDELAEEALAAKHAP